MRSGLLFSADQIREQKVLKNRPGPILLTPKYHQFPSDYSKEETPDPIPNSEAKLLRADGTAGFPVGE